ncbi:MAG: sporulation protein [Defluviitaleaceae bacterium]|nr:sporulation protein [Defluviitaleaceae bacterium]
MNSSDNLKMFFSKMEDFVSTKTVVGDAVHIGDVILVPLVDITFGMGTGGGGEDGKSGGGGGGGAKMSPSAVVVIINGTAQLINVKGQDSVNKLIDMVPGILSKFNLGSLFGKKDDAEEQLESIGD